MTQEPVLAEAMARLVLPAGVDIRAWREADFPSIQRLSRAEGWTTAVSRPADALAAWQRSWPALVATAGDEPAGFVRALTDGAVTTYVAELLVAPAWRGRGLGRALLRACHALCPSTRLDLLSAETAHGFYTALGFRGYPGFRQSRWAELAAPADGRRPGGG